MATPDIMRQTAELKGLGSKRMARAVLGAVCSALSIGYLVSALNMPSGSTESPGPGMFPVGVGIAAIVISLVVVGEAFFTRTDAGTVELPSGQQLRQCIIFMLTLVLFILVLPIAGQYLASCLYVVAFLRFGGGLGWIRSIPFGILIGAGLTLIFTEFLGIQLPHGIW